MSVSLSWDQSLRVQGLNVTVKSFCGYLKGKEKFSRSALFVAQLKNVKIFFNVCKYCVWYGRFEQRRVMARRS